MAIRIKDAFAMTEVLQKASTSSLTILETCGSLREMDKGEHLFRDKEPVNFLYFIIYGAAALYKLNSLGESKVIFICSKGNMLNEVIIQDLPASINCEILKKSLILSFPKSTFIQVMSQDFALTKAVMDSMSIKIRRLYRQLKNTTNSIRLDKKIAAKLWKLSMDYGIPCDNGIKIDVELSITYLADMLGSKRETVSKQLKVLGSEGLLIFEKNHFIIPNRDALMVYFKKE